MSESPIEYWRKVKDGDKKKVRKALKRLDKEHGKHLDRLANSVHEETFKKVDCLDCANCCTSIPPIVNHTDARRIASHLHMSESEFLSKHTVTDEDGDVVMRTVPCVFLEADNTCRIYEVRPKACREYPHTDGSSFSQNAHLHFDNAMHCPAVYHIVLEMNKRIPD